MPRKWLLPLAVRAILRPSCSHITALLHPCTSQSLPSNANKDGEQKPNRISPDQRGEQETQHFQRDCSPPPQCCLPALLELKQQLQPTTLEIPANHLPQGALLSAWICLRWQELTHGWLKITE